MSLRKVMRKRYLLLNVALLISCNSQTPSRGEPADPYIQNLKNQFSGIQTRQSSLPQIEGMYLPGWLLRTNNCNHLIVSDNEAKSLFLINTDGDLLHSAGGEGRGPKEYQSILNPHMGNDGRLYVIDALLFRINIYEIEDERLTFIESVSYKNPENYFLTAMYVTDYGHFGLFQESPNGYFSPENHYYFYRLDENFAIHEQLLEIPGHERLKFVTPQFTLYTPHEYSKKTNWSLDQEWFYYITTGDETIHRYHLATGKKGSLSFFELEERSKNDAFVEAVEKHHPNAKEEVFMEKLEEIKSLPLFSGFHVEDGKVFLNVLATPGEDQMVIYIDPESEEIKYFQTAYGFTPRSLCGNHLYGLNFRTDEEIRLMDIEISFQE